MRCLVFIILMTATLAAQAQRAERNYLRHGNRLYRDSSYVKSEIDYRKALNVNPNSSEAHYNLGNSLIMQQKGQDAMEQLTAAAKLTQDKSKLAQIYHNMGVILQSNKKYEECIEAYKKSLRNNPKDDETRYNLALAQKMLKDQQQQNQNKDQNKDKDKKDQDKKDQNKDQDKKDQDKKDQNKDQDKKDQNKDQDNKDQKNNQQQQQQNQMSKENAEQLLNAVMQDEKDVQNKVKKQLQMRGKKLQKDW